MKRPLVLALMQTIILLLALIYAAPSRAASEVIEHSTFTSQNWTSGLHMTAGLGVNSSYFESDFIRENVGAGLNVHTDVGYYFYNLFAIETSVNVMLTRVQSVLVWDTLMTMGLRTRLPAWFGPNHSSPYLRVAGGKGPSVLIYKGSDPSAYNIGGERAQIEGDIFSASYGVLQNARDGSVWFIELQTSMNRYRKVEAIDDVDGVPEVIFSAPVNDNASMYSISLTFGVVIF